MNPIPKTKIIRLKGQKLAKLNETIHQKENRDHHRHLYSCQCGCRSNDDRIGAMNIQFLGTMWISGDNNPRYERISTTSE